MGRTKKIPKNARMPTYNNASGARDPVRVWVRRFARRACVAFEAKNGFMRQ
jgi:hypothetical protein